MGYIVHEYSQGSNGALALVGSMGSTYIGLIDVDDGEIMFLGPTLVFLRNALRYREAASIPNPQLPLGPGNLPNLSVGVDVVYQSLGFMNGFFVDFNSLYALESGKSEDQSLASSYFEAVKHLQAKSSGIVAPTQKDIQMVRSDVH